MTIFKTERLSSDHAIADAVDKVQVAVEQTLGRSLPLASATWDLREDARGRSILVLSAKDAFGEAKAVFAPDELKRSDHLTDRFNRLAGDVLQSSRRAVIRVADKFINAADLDALRNRVNEIPDIASHRFRMDNRITLRGDNLLIQDFTIEVDESAADAVRKAVLQSGFQLKSEPLALRAGVADAVRRLAAMHAGDSVEPPRIVIWCGLNDSENIRLLEIADGAFDPGDGSLDGIALSARGTVPGAKYLIVHLASPTELRTALEINPTNPVVMSLMGNQFELVYPLGGLIDFLAEFPAINGARL